ncbi:unnamed protein product [Linum trigynum]|uniref:Uncharacterized protein n=1 Tax=Linum trigynum TaxID=586398 RepID=A0AAV2DRS0_9ROSI
MLRRAGNGRWDLSSSRAGQWEEVAPAGAGAGAGRTDAGRSREAGFAGSLLAEERLTWVRRGFAGQINDELARSTSGERLWGLAMATGSGDGEW